MCKKVNFNVIEKVKTPNRKDIEKTIKMSYNIFICYKKVGGLLWTKYLRN